MSEPQRRLDDLDLDNLEAAALGRTGVGVLAHPVDVLRLVAEVRWYKKNANLAPPVHPDTLAVIRREVERMHSSGTLRPSRVPSFPKSDGGDAPHVVTEGK